MSLATEEPVVYVKHTVDVLKAQDVDVWRILKKCGIREGELTLGRSHISKQQYGEFLNIVMSDVDVPGLGLLDGQDMNLLDHGILGYAMFASATAREAIERHTKYQDIIGAVLKTNLIVDAESAHLRVVEISRPQLADTEEKLRYQTEQLFCLWNQHGAAFGQNRQWLKRVDFSYPKPSYCKLYSDFFQCPIYFDQPYSQISFDMDVLDQKLSFSNEDAAKLCDKQCSALLEELKDEEGVTGEVRKYLARNPGRTQSIQEMASRLAMSERTLSRKLAEEKTTYKTVVLNFRMEIAMGCLINKSMSLADVAYACGYTESSSFFRAFKRYFNKSPRKFRNDLLANK